MSSYAFGNSDIFSVLISQMQVLSLPDYNNVIGYVFIADYNTQKLKPKQFVNGQR